MTPRLFMYKVRTLAFIMLAAVLVRADGKTRGIYRNWGKP